MDKNEYNKDKYTRTGVYIQEEEWQEFKSACKDNGVSMASVIRDIMEEYIRSRKNG